jgi:hypothetical protein
MPIGGAQPPASASAKELGGEIASFGPNQEFTTQAMEQGEKGQGRPLRQIWPPGQGC